MTTPILYRRRSLPGLGGPLTVPPALAGFAWKLSYENGSPVNTGDQDIEGSIKTSTDNPTSEVWQRVSIDTDQVARVALSSGQFWQPYADLEDMAFSSEFYVRIEYRLVSRGSGDTTTRLFQVLDPINGTVFLSVYEADGDIRLTEGVNGPLEAFATGEGGISNMWRTLDVYVKTDSGAGDGVLRVWMNGSATAAAEITTHGQALTDIFVAAGLGSVQDDVELHLAEMTIFAPDDSPVGVTPRSAGWSSDPLYQEYVGPVTAINVSPNPPSVADGAVSGTSFATLQRTGGQGDGTWSLTGDLATIAQVAGTSLELTVQADEASHDGTTGTVSYSGDSAGGSPADVTVDLQVVVAATNLALSATTGRSQTSGTLDTTSPLAFLKMKWRSEPLMANENASTEAEKPYAGSVTRCGLDQITSESDAAIIHVTTLAGDDRVGSLVWAANTDTDNQGNDIAGKPVIIVFDVSGHIDLEEDFIVQKNNRWFAGQTAPQASNGSGGVFVHKQTKHVESNNVIVEHMRFIDGRDVPGQNAACRVVGGTEERLNVIMRNCAFYWGSDQTFDFRADASGGGRLDNCSLLDSFIAESHQNESYGYNSLFRRASHRIEDSRNLFGGGKTRSPGQSVATSAAHVNNYTYGVWKYAVRIFTRTWSNSSSTQEPVGQTLTHVGNVLEAGPDRDTDTTHYVHHYNIDDSQPLNGMRQYFNDEWVRGGPAFYEPNLSGHTFLADPPLWPRRPFMPHEDVESYILNHGGPWPNDRTDTESRIVNTWQSRGSLRKQFVDHEASADFPDVNIADTTGQPPSLPANPFATAANGLTNIENWLEQQHIAVGGAPWQDFDRWLRFPWGGRVRVNKGTGAVDFDPSDMPAGEQGVIEITRADGSTVTVTCEAV